MEARKLPDTEFKTMAIIMLKEISENFNNIKKRHNNHKKELVKKQSYNIWNEE